MLPKNSKHFIQPAAEETGLSYEIVEDIINYYYSELRKYLSDLKHPIVRIENLGTFKTSHKKLKEFYIRYSKHIEVASTDTIRQMSVKKRAEDKLNKVIAIQELIHEEKKRKAEFYKKKRDGKV